MNKFFALYLKFLLITLVLGFAFMAWTDEHDGYNTVENFAIIFMIIGLVFFLRHKSFRSEVHFTNGKNNIVINGAVYETKDLLFDKSVGYIIKRRKDRLELFRYYPGWGLGLPHVHLNSVFKAGAKIAGNVEAEIESSQSDKAATLMRQKGIHADHQYLVGDRVCLVDDRRKTVTLVSSDLTEVTKALNEITFKLNGVKHDDSSRMVLVIKEIISGDILLFGDLPTKEALELEALFSK